MEWYWSLSLWVGGFLILVLAGIPVFYAFLAIDIIGMFFLMGGAPGLELLIDSIYDSLSVFVLLPITLFVLMGELMLCSGAAGRIIDALDQWIGSVRGRLAYLAVVSGGVFASLSGSSIGAAAMLGRSLVPEMEKRGYRTPMSIGPILGSGGLAIMIPPSGLGVVLAVVAEVSIGKLLVAIVIPGLLMALLYCSYIWVRCRVSPELSPPYSKPDATFRARVRDTVVHVLPFGLVVFSVVGTIFLGIATPTEAAALGVSATVLLTLGYRRLTFRVFREAIENTLRIAVMILLILAAASVYSRLLAFSGVTGALVEWATALSVSPVTMIMMMILATLILGGFVTGLPLMLITIPVFMPLVKSMGYDPLWFSVVFLLLVEMAQTTPPHGTLLHVMRGIAPAETSAAAIIRAGLPFLVCDLIVVLAMVLAPDIVLWLPDAMR